MTCGPGGTGAVVFDLYVKSALKEEAKFKDYPGAMLGMEDSDDVGGVGIIYEDEEAWDVEYGFGYGVVYGGITITGYVGLGHFEKTKVGNKMEPIPESVEVFKRSWIRKAMSVTGEGTKYAKDFSAGEIKDSTSDSASCSYMANNRHREPSKISWKKVAEEADKIEDWVKDSKWNELNQWTKVASGSTGTQGVVRMPGAAICYPYRFVVIGGGRGLSGTRSSSHSPLDVLKGAVGKVDGEDWFFYKKAYTAGDFRVELE